MLIAIKKTAFFSTALLLLSCTFLFSQKIEDPIEDAITVELLLVEYTHRDGFNWGIDIINAQKAKFNDANFASGDENGNFSFNYDVTNSLTDKFKLNLQALVQENIAVIAQNPRITVESGTAANLNIKESKYVQLQTASQNGLSTNLQQIDAGIDFSITPTVVNDSTIKINVNGTLSEFIPLSSSGGDYNIESKTIKTDVTMKKGQTLVIGGLIKEENYELESGVPILRRIPLLGKLFSRIESRIVFKEIVIYVTAYFAKEFLKNENGDYKEKSLLYSKQLYESSLKKIKKKQ
jgi:general secretion pathway protein D